MGIKFLKIAAVYFAVGVLLGLIMGIIHDFRLSSVHAHINLLGWVSMALFGVIYHFYPKAAETGLAKTHFWLYNICMPVMQLSIALQLLVSESFLPVTIVSSTLLVVSVILFTINLLTKVSASSAASSGSGVSI